VNRPPAPAGDAARTNEGSSVTVAVLANDSDPDGDPLTVASAAQGAIGTVIINSNGTVTYRSNPGWAGADSFSYTVSDGRGGTGGSTVNVSVVPRTLHVRDLDGLRANTNFARWRATVRITVVNAAGSPVPGATVAGSWSAAASRTASAVTDANGIATVQKAGLSRRKTPSVTFTVAAISHATLSYHPARNRDREGDSNGTTIVVRRP
jgi:hypothetical protein